MTDGQLLAYKATPLHGQNGLGVASIEAWPAVGGGLLIGHCRAVAGGNGTATPFGEDRFLDRRLYRCCYAHPALCPPGTGSALLHARPGHGGARSIRLPDRGVDITH